MGVELNALSQELDDELLYVLVDELGVKGHMSDEGYTEGYRRGHNYARRRFQTEGIQRIGQDLNDFLTAGCVAFRHMRGAKDFLTTVVQREMEILDRIHAVDPYPFEIEAAMQTASSSCG